MTVEGLLKIADTDRAAWATKFTDLVNQAQDREDGGAKCGWSDAAQQYCYRIKGHPSIQHANITHYPETNNVNPERTHGRVSVVWFEKKE